MGTRYNRIINVLSKYIKIHFFFLEIYFFFCRTKFCILPEIKMYISDIAWASLRNVTIFFRLTNYNTDFCVLCYVLRC